MVTSIAAKNGLTWTHLSEPSTTELAAFVRETKLTPSDAEFIAQNHHRPEITLQPNYLIILIHVPVFDKQTRTTSSASLYLLITSQRLWTISHHPLPPLSKLVERYIASPDVWEEYAADSPTAVAVHLIKLMYDSAFRKVERLTKYIDIAEDAVFQGHERKMVEEISVLMRDVMDFRKVIRPQRTLFLTIPTHPLIPGPLHAQWWRLNNHIRKLWELSTGLFESVKELRDTNDSLIQHKENELLRLLTYFSIVSIPVLIILSPIDPFAPSSLTKALLYWGLLGLLLALLVVIYLHFRGKRVL